MRHRFLTRPLSAVLTGLALTLVGTLFAAATSSCRRARPRPRARPHGPDRPGHPHHPDHGDRPTVVLVHGAFADSSGWEAVATQLMDQGYPVLAFSNPLRDPISDGAYLREFLTTVEGPVVLVGHSYGGAVISNAATGNPAVRSLVYVAAYAPAEGESVAEANYLGGGHTTVTDHLVSGRSRARPKQRRRLHRPGMVRRALRAGPAAPDHPASWQPRSDPAPGSPGDGVGPAGLGGDPELVHGRHAGPDHPAGGRAGDGRPGRCRVVEVDSSHVVMMSHPRAVTKVIREAAR